MHKALHSFIIINKQTSFPLAWPAQGNRNHSTGFTSVSCAEHPQPTSSNPAVYHCKAAGEHSSLHQTFCSESLVQPSEGSSTPRTPAAGTELSQAFPPQPAHLSLTLSCSGAGMLQPHYWMWDRRVLAMRELHSHVPKKCSGSILFSISAASKSMPWTALKGSSEMAGQHSWAQRAAAVKAKTCLSQVTQTSANLHMLRMDLSKACIWAKPYGL